VLTHVCQAWRQVFTSRLSLWADLDCVNADKTRVYLERSKSFPITLALYRNYNPPPHDSFFQITPHAIGRLKSLSVWGTLENLQGITDHLSHPAPLLDYMSIIGRCKPEQEGTPTLTSAILGGDISSLRKLCLEYVRTELPWRNMDNLTSLRLVYTSLVSTSQLLDFFEGAPNLRKVTLHFETPISGTQSGRLVSLAHLKKMTIDGDPSCVLLNHLLIPVGARLVTEVDLPSPPIKDHPPRFLDNLRNLPNFTTIEIFAALVPSIQLIGPNGEVLMCPAEEDIPLLLGFLALFDTTKTERLKIDFDDSPSGYPPYHTLLPMKDLRTLELYQCVSLRNFISDLDPSMNSSGVVICPKLEKLVIGHCGTLDINDVIRMVAARESGGAKLNSVQIITYSEGTTYVPPIVLELGEYISHLECR